VTDGYERITDELRRLDDELAAAVTLPSVDTVIRCASTLNRASTAAAAAVLTVGALGATTVIAQFTVPDPAVGTAAAVTPGAAPSERFGIGASLPVVEQVPAPVEGAPTFEDPAPVEAAPPPPGPGLPAAPPPPGPPAVVPTTVVPLQPTTTTRRPSNNDEGDDEKPTKTRTSKPNPPDPPTEPTEPDPPTEPTEPDPPTSDPADPPSDPPSDDNEDS
jgi:hypothetical protein